MTPEPDLFVVCKSCGSEVSPYVTECPYCGQRVRKRAPKIDKGSPEAPARRRRPSLPRLRPGEIPGIAPETRPYAIFALLGASLAATLVWRAGAMSLVELGAVYGPVDNDWWRLVASPFLHENLGYQLIALVAAAIFGTHLERRFGWLAVAAVFLIAGAAGCGLSEALADYPAVGANGAALGLLCAWLVDDRRAFRRGDDRGTDLLGVYVIAAVLALVPLAETTASAPAALGGAVAGSLLGLAISALRG